MNRTRPTQRRVHLTETTLVDNSPVTITVGFFPDRTPCELFVEVAKPGTLLRSMLNAWVMSVSVGLQCGASLDQLLGPVLDFRSEEYPAVIASKALELAASYLKEGLGPPVQVDVEGSEPPEVAA
jgi:hypothetical protein